MMIVEVVCIALVFVVAAVVIIANVVIARSECRTNSDLFEAERVTVGEVLGLCQNPAKNERGELAAADVERARRALRTYVFGAGASERTGNSLRAGEGEGDGRR